MTKMTREERKLFDAQADHEAWSLAHEILEPWVRTKKPIASDELTQVMEKALAYVEMEPNRTRCAGVPPSGHGATRVRRVRAARSRGLAGLEELKERLRAAGYDNTANKLLEAPGRMDGASTSTRSCSGRERSRCASPGPLRRHFSVVVAVA
jgi:hypothetical protein